MAVKVDPDSGRKIYRYVAACAGREIPPDMQVQWNEGIIGKLARMAGVSTGQTHLNFAYTSKISIFGGKNDE